MLYLLESMLAKIVSVQYVFYLLEPTPVKIISVLSVPYLPETVMESTSHLVALVPCAIAPFTVDAFVVKAAVRMSTVESFVLAGVRAVVAGFELEGGYETSW